MFDFTDLIAERTRDFTGREWVFAKVDQWLGDPDAPPFFIITGEPGIGKTTIAAALPLTGRDRSRRPRNWKGRPGQWGTGGRYDTTWRMVDNVPRQEQCQRPEDELLWYNMR